MTVVGVAGDVQYAGLETDPTVDVYLPQGLFPQAAITLIARTQGDPLNEVTEVRERIRTVDQHAFVTNIRSMDQLIAGSQAERFWCRFDLAGPASVAIQALHRHRPNKYSAELHVPIRVRGPQCSVARNASASST